MKTIIIILALLLAGTAWGEECSIHKYILLKNTITGEYKIQRNFPIEHPFKADNIWGEVRPLVWCGTYGGKGEVSEWCKDVPESKKFDGFGGDNPKDYTSVDALSGKGIKKYVEQLNKWAKENYEDCLKKQEIENAWQVIDSKTP